MNKKGFSKTGIVLIGSMLVCLLICLCVIIPGGFGKDGESSKLDDEGAPNMKTLVEEGTPIFLLDKRASTKALMQAFDDGDVVSFSVETTKKDDNSTTVDVGNSDNEKDILAVYKALKNLVITEELDQASASGKTTVIIFKMKDGSEADFTFPESDTFQIDDQVYIVEGSDALWEAIGMQK